MCVSLSLSLSSGSIDVCIICPTPLVAVDLDGDGCNETCDCKKPSGVLVSPFLDSFLVAATVGDFGPIASPTGDIKPPVGSLTGAASASAATKLAAPKIENGVCNNCPNIPFYNSEFCSPGLDCGPAGILGRRRNNKEI